MPNQTSPSRYKGHVWLQILGTVALLVIGGTVAAVLVNNRKQPQKKERVITPPVVQVIKVSRQTVNIDVEGFGSVRAQTRTNLIPQVSGIVTELHPNMKSGGFIPAGQPLFQIDTSDYKLAQSQAESRQASAMAAIASAEAQIDESDERILDAERDLRRTKKLALTDVAKEREIEKAETHLRVQKALLRVAQSRWESAFADLARAQADIAQAVLNLKRTTVTLPFDAIVINEQVDAGQRVSAGQSVGAVYGAKAFEIAVPLEDKQLKWIEGVPIGRIGALTKAQISKLPHASVQSEFAGVKTIRTGKVVRTDGVIDERSRMIKLVIQIDDPLSIYATTEADKSPPLLPGAFVRVTVHGKALNNVFRIPRHALHPNNTIYVARNEKLHMAAVEVERKDRNFAYVRSTLIKGKPTLDDGESIVITPLDTPTHGMAIKTAPAPSTTSKK